MILEAFETMLDRTPPTWVRRVEAAALMGVFSEAFDVKPPATEDLSADGALRAFREFSAACMEAALVDEGVAADYRARLREHAHDLGAKVRVVVPVRRSSAMRLVRYFYRGIDIDLVGEAPGDLRFGPCSFAQRYTPGDCWLMSAFDEGFICGVLGFDGELAFSCRLTEGAPCCRARLE